MVEVVDVHVLYCGQGMTNWIEYYATQADRNANPPRPSMTAIVDMGGGGLDRDIGVDFIVERLELFGAGRRRIATAVISHQDRDHWNLIPHFLTALEKNDMLGNPVADENVTIGIVYRGGSAWKQAASDTVQRLVDKLDGNDENFTPSYSNYSGGTTAIVTQGQCEIRVILSNAPSTDTQSGFQENGTSAVVAVELGGKSVILPGDATYETMHKINEIYKGAGAKPATCFGLSIPHHGSLRTAVPNYDRDADYDDLDTEIVSTFSNHLSAQKVVASAGPRNRHHHPLLEIVNMFGKSAPASGDTHYLQVYSFADSDWQRPAEQKKVWTTAGWEKIITHSVGKKPKSITTYKMLLEGVTVTLFSNGHAELTTLPLKARRLPATAATDARTAAPPSPEERERRAGRDGGAS